MSKTCALALSAASVFARCLTIFKLSWSAFGVVLRPRCTKVRELVVLYVKTGEVRTRLSHVEAIKMQLHGTSSINLYLSISNG